MEGYDVLMGNMTVTRNGGYFGYFGLCESRFREVVPAEQILLEAGRVDEIVIPTIPSQDDEKHDVELKEGDSDDLACVVCMARRKTCMAEPCNHVSYCIKCARIAKMECPICKTQIKSIKRIFL